MITDHFLYFYTMVKNPSSVKSPDQVTGKEVRGLDPVHWTLVSPGLVVYGQIVRVERVL